MSPLSTLRVYGTPAGLTDADLRAALALPTTWGVGTTDALALALNGDVYGKLVMRKELQVGVVGGWLSGLVGGCMRRWVGGRAGLLLPPPLEVWHPPPLNTHTLAQLPGPLDTNATPPTNDSLTLGLGLGLGIPLLVAACAAVWWFKLRQRGAYGSPLNEPMVAG